MEISTPGTIDAVVADAVGAGYQASVRLVRDWTAKGLLDAPRRRASGRGKGSKPALYAPAQRMLFLTLLHHRQHGGLSIPGLARIPVSVWLYFGVDHVPTRQAKNAFTTWLGDPRSSLSEAARLAAETTAQLDSPRASSRSRRALVGLLADIAYRGRLDDEAALRQAVRDVFEPGDGLIKKSIGHPSAPLSTDAVVEIIGANLEGVRQVTERRVSLADFEEAGQRQRESMAEYVRDRPSIAAGAWGQADSLYAEPTLQWLVEESCAQLLMIIGLQSRPSW